MMRQARQRVVSAEALARAEAAYLGLALGDALGATVEFMTPREIAHRFAGAGGVHREIIGGGWLHLRCGGWPFDSLALAQDRRLGG